MIYPALITALTMLLYLVLAINVSKARKKYGVALPATTGNPDFERVYRVHMNTLEQLMLFLPSLWLCAVFINPLIASGLGLVWLVGRILFARGYYKSVEGRNLGFIIAILVNVLLLLGGIGGIARAFYIGLFVMNRQFPPQ